MNKSTCQDRDSIDREAADWVVRWEDRESHPTGKTQFKWFSWLRRSPKHVQAYLDTADIYERLGRMDPENRIDIDEWLAQRSAPVVSLATSHADLRRPPDPPSTMSRVRSHWRPTAIAASLFGAALISAALIPDADTYRTATGQQSTYRFADGSVMNLNTRSTAKIRFSTRERSIELNGEALFTVAPDATRPFYVHTEDATIRAVGTKFNVFSQGGETRVAVVEGVVQVTQQEPAAKDTPLVLSAGEAARVSGDKVQRQPASKVGTVVAWQHQQLVFEDATLADVAAEFNRYNDRQIRVEDSLGKTKRLSGTFDALHPQSLLLYLQKDSELDVRAIGDKVIVRRSR